MLEDVGVQEQNARTTRRNRRQVAEAHIARPQTRQRARDALEETSSECLEVITSLASYHNASSQQIGNIAEVRSTRSTVSKEDETVSGSEAIASTLQACSAPY